MSASSGLPGHCPRCGCALNNHHVQPCAGGDYSKRTKTFTKCDFTWYQCTQPFAHSTKVQYVDCMTCPQHPAARPLGVLPSEATADELGIPYPTVTGDDRWGEPDELAAPVETYEEQDDASLPSSYRRPIYSHYRDLSGGTDPLVDDIVGGMSSLNMADMEPAAASSSASVVTVDAKRDGKYVRFDYRGSAIKSNLDKWVNTGSRFEFYSQDRDVVFCAKRIKGHKS